MNTYQILTTHLIIKRIFPIIDLNLSLFIIKMDTSIFKLHLDELIGNDKALKLSDALDKHGAIIAGGAVLGPYADFKSSDIDIYVPISKGSAFLEDSGIKLWHTRFVSAPPYDKSFFRKNHILVKFEGWIRGKIDIMLVNDDIPVETVAKNFDLSFCQIWYDGKVVEATDPNDIKNKSGKLTNEYVVSLVSQLNVFIIKRIKKYKKRGFKITIECDGDFLVEKREKTVVSDEAWVVSTLYKKFLDICIVHYQYLNSGYNTRRWFDFDEYVQTKLYDIVCNFPLQIFTLSNLNQVFKDAAPSIGQNGSTILMRSFLDYYREYWQFLDDEWKDKFRNVLGDQVGEFIRIENTNYESGAESDSDADSAGSESDDENYMS
jgi:hypothetical protein